MPSSLLTLLPVALKPVFPRTVSLVSMLCLPSFLVSSKRSVVVTRWIQQPQVKPRYKAIMKEGDNMIARSTNLDWYKGPTVLEALDQISEPKRLSDKPQILVLEEMCFL